jgi:hypothetical protein
VTISKDDAGQALRDIAAASGRVREAKGYGYASPFLVIWGLVWMIADALTQFEPGWTMAWPLCIAVGAAACLVASFNLTRLANFPGETAGRWRYFAVWFVVMGFLVALFLVIPVTSGREVHSIFGLVFGCIYVAMGVWTGWRLAALGLALAALTLVGFYAAPAGWYALYMGLVSGGALVLGGLWLRRL